MLRNESEAGTSKKSITPSQHYGTKSLQVEGQRLEDGTIYHSFMDEDHFHDEQENKMNKLSHMYRDPDGAKYYFDDNGNRVKVLKEREHEDHPDDEYHHDGHLPKVDDDVATPKVAVSRKTLSAGWM